MNDLEHNPDQSGGAGDQSHLGTAPVGRLILKFAVPGIVAMMVNALYNIVDQIFIGRGVGYLGNGAANVVLLITLVALALAMLLGDGAAAYFSLNLGAGEQEKAAKGAGTAILTVAAVSIAVSVFGILFLEPVIRLFGGTDILMPYAKDYGFIIVLGLPFIMISTSVNSLIRADGSPRYAMASMIAGALVNGCLDPVFIFGFGWGMKGAAFSTLIGQFVSFLLSVLYLRRFKNIRLTREAFRPKAAVVGKICGLGVSSFIDQIAFALVMTVNNNLIVHYGAMTAYGSEIPLTAYGIAMKVQEILFTVLLGLALGMQPIVGYNYGARNYGRVKKAYFLTVAAGTAISIFATLLFVLCPEPIIHLFGSRQNELYQEFSKLFFRTYFLVYIFFGYQTITGVFFQAIGKPAQAATISLCYQLVFKIVSAVALCGALGLMGVLWSGPIADSLIFILATTLVCREMVKINRLQAGASGNK